MRFAENDTDSFMSCSQESKTGMYLENDKVVLKSIGYRSVKLIGRIVT